MLGRHVYRVHLADGSWSVTKEGEGNARKTFSSRDEALAEACRLASGDQPSRITVDDGDGVIVEERLFGADVSAELDSTA
jgi:hypothetical protein